MSLLICVCNNMNLFIYLCLQSHTSIYFTILYFLPYIIIFYHRFGNVIGMAGVTVAVASTLGSIWTQSPTTGTLYEFMLIAALTAIGGALGKNENLIYASLFHLMYYSISYHILPCHVMLDLHMHYTIF